MFEKHNCDKLLTIQKFQKDDVYKKFKLDTNKVKIAIIDDKFNQRNALAKCGYNNVTIYDDFTDVNLFKDYDAILCDIDGVGVDLDPIQQGIGVAKLLKKHYPEKLVILFSNHSPSEFESDYENNSSKELDGFINKTWPIQKWIEDLNEKCSIFWNPIASWKFVENKMRYAGNSNAEIAYLEHIFVKSLLSEHNYFTAKKLELSNSDVINVLSIAANFITILQTIRSNF